MVWEISWGQGFNGARALRKADKPSSTQIGCCLFAAVSCLNSAVFSGDEMPDDRCRSYKPRGYIEAFVGEVYAAGRLLNIHRRPSSVICLPD
jgi:hypothetical protein